MKFMKFSPKTGQTGNGNGNGNGKANGNGHAKPAAATATKEQEPVEAVVDQTAEEAAGSDSPSAMKKFISALMGELREREDTIKALQSEIAAEREAARDQAQATEERFQHEIETRDEAVTRQLGSRDEHIVKLEETLAAERSEKEAALEWKSAREQEDAQRAIGSRVGVDVSSILYAAETAAEALRTQSQAEAEDLVASATAHAEEIVASASSHADDILSKAKAKAKAIRAKADEHDAAFQAKMQTIVGEVRQAYASLGELASSLTHLEDPKLVVEEQVPVDATV